jgi:threonine/homoserine/homoserine lactone efflux protein
VLLAVYDWGVLLGVLFFFPIAALLLNYLIYRWALVPRWLSIWGIAGAVWLIVRGFDRTEDSPAQSSAVARPPVRA